jgi:hypothetical protein
MRRYDMDDVDLGGDVTLSAEDHGEDGVLFYIEAPDPQAEDYLNEEGDIVAVYNKHVCLGEEEMEQLVFYFQAWQQDKGVSHCTPTSTV